MGEPRFDCHVGLVVPDEIRQEHLDRRDAERIYNSGVRKRLEGILRKPGKTDPRVQAKYDALAIAADKERVRVDNYFSDSGKKVDHLVNIMGYGNLKGNVKLKVSGVVIDGNRMADWERKVVGAAYMACYQRGNPNQQ